MTDDKYVERPEYPERDNRRYAYPAHYCMYQHRVHKKGCLCRCPNCC